MKKLLLSAIILFIALTSFSQSEKFTQAMKKNLGAMDSSFKNPADLLKLANSFERIASAEKNQWLAFYYAAFCQVNVGFMEQDKSKVDAIADKAASLIATADSLAPNNSEASMLLLLSAPYSCHLVIGSTIM